VSCERYYKPEELIDGNKCPDHNRECIEQSEENYFFLLSKFQDQLIGKIESGEMAIGPASRKNEILSKLRLGLEDVSISRANVKWGIPVPFDPSQTIYVWFDALLNYYTATKIYQKEDFWPANLHLMAKDILWFHAVIWPAMLLAYGGADFPLPRKVFANGFFTINGSKMSKTLGNVIDPNEVVDKFGSDAVRNALLREFPFGEDGDISVEKIAKRYSDDLANALGNLVQRVLVMINKWNITTDLPETIFTSKKVSEFSSVELSEYKPFLVSLRLAAADNGPDHSWTSWVNSSIEDLDFKFALEQIWAIVNGANFFINDKKPWVLAGEDDETLSRVVNVLYEALVGIATLITPFMPETSEKIQEQLTTLEPKPLFPRIES
jgi:methionyl-tRNA synthetase